jgi:hypothetical protein
VGKHEGCQQQRQKDFFHEKRKDDETEKTGPAQSSGMVCTFARVAVFEAHRPPLPGLPLRLTAAACRRQTQPAGVDAFFPDKRGLVVEVP